MGYFSFLDCETGEQIKIGANRPVYLLIPAEFGGGHIRETYNDGYGHFSVCDVYELVAVWNRSKLPELLPHKPQLSEFGGLFPWELRELHEQGLNDEQIELENYKAQTHYHLKALARWRVTCEMLKDYAAGLDDEEMIDKYDNDFLREIGIAIAGDDEEPARLPFPIKVTYSETATYETSAPSKYDPLQGCD